MSIIPPPLERFCSHPSDNIIAMTLAGVVLAAPSDEFAIAAPLLSKPGGAPLDDPPPPSGREWGPGRDAPRAPTQTEYCDAGMGGIAGSADFGFRNPGNCPPPPPDGVAGPGPGGGLSPSLGHRAAHDPHTPWARAGRHRNDNPVVYTTEMDCRVPMTLRDLGSSLVVWWGEGSAPAAPGSPPEVLPYPMGCPGYIHVPGGLYRHVKTRCKGSASGHYGSRESGAAL